ncbi:polymorphic toxin-type HINT domain-containing protein [Streptomyces chitinivorans]|uniref:Polymorphic toxin-type HINT domain-containing protein n=1 Tax=Streptomyces chitinivorans TaxID=1257027 RepID=A0ABW7HXT6_9ACTN|nr:polymorphic toxin-type HINT domain-containing protein [Streptomyces chitinivorans]MDH2407415.1 polymorphic toxin-type HINT domain-containing protein [Streptomyces chitinivorans]
MNPFRGRLLSRRIPKRVVGAVVLGLNLALVGTTAEAVPLDKDTGKGRPGVQGSADPAEGRDAKTAPRPTDPTKKAAVTRLDKAEWPKPGSAEIAVAADAKTAERTEVGGLPVTVTAAAPEKPGKKAAENKRAGKAEAGKAGASPAEVRITSLDRERAAELDSAVVLKVSRTDGSEQPGPVELSLDYSEFAEGYGGGYGSRLRLVKLPDCAATAAPGTAECPELPVPLASDNDTSKRTVTARVEAQPAKPGLSTQAGEPSTLVALTSGTSSDKGDYKATPLSPSASWSVANSSGGFSWNYPFRTVPTPGGLTPTIGLGYSSQSVDGRTSVTNNQGSWVGDGFSYEPGYIERAYKPCADDGHKTSAEQCWAFDNATIMLEGSSSQLIKDDDTGEWHFTGESGARVEKLTGAANGDDNGEHWRVTTTDGTEYHFGLNRLPGWTSGKEETDSTWTVPVFGDDSGEPCHDATFSKAHCDQAWRWNLDYVKDTHGNVMSYFYGAETNHYALNGKTDTDGTAYHRGGYLKRIDYGQRHEQVYAAKAPARVKFTVAERCLPTDTFDCAASKRTTANAAHWPDTPVDLECKAGTHCKAGQISPSFWTTKRLTGITTQMRTGADTYEDVDAWTLTHRFLDNGDDSKTLWLSKIGHEGRVGDDHIAMPSVDLYGIQLENRVDADGDNIDAFHRYRLASVLSETGAQLDVNYAPTECTAKALPAPGKSTKRCYPVKWAPPGHTEPITDWFHKYVVAEIVETDRTGGGDDLVTRYDYQGPAAWRHAEPDGITDEKYLTWGQWQGYGKVTVTSGDGETTSTRTDHTYLRGMHGDKDPDGGTRSVTVTDSTGKSYTDHKEYTGFELEAATYDGGRIVSKVVNEPWKHDTAVQTRSWGTTKATITRTGTTRGYNLLSDGTWRKTRSVSVYDTDTDTGRLLRTDDFGDLATTDDDRCTRLWYADNPARNIYELPSRSEAVSVACSATPDRTTQVIADERTHYDGGGFGDAPTKGDATRTERLTSHDGTKGTYQVTGTTTYDAFGRPTAQTDAAGATTRTEYTDVNGLISQTEVTNALGHVTTTDYAPAWGQSTGQTDPNGKRTDLAHDALGRLVSVWMPDRRKTQTPSIKYSYTVRKDKVVAVRTEKVEISGEYGTEYELYDSLLRPRQKQTEGPDGSRMVADTFYDGTGKVRKANATYNALGAPSDELLVVNDGQVGAQTLTEYDGLGRATAQTLAVAGVEQWRTTTAYDGERTHVDPPEGGVPTTTITDAAGRMTELRHYHGDAPNPDGAAGPGNGYDATKYTYTPAGQLETVTDAQGNTWRYEYDQLGREVKSIDPDSGTSTTTYDAADRPVSTMDARGKVVSTVYDKLGRATSTWEGQPQLGTKLTETRYDKAGWLGHAYASLRYVNGGSQYFATVTQAMDEYYRPLKTAYSVPSSEGALAGVYTFTSTYNRDGTLGGQGMPAAGGLGSEAIVFGYDELQRPTSMTGNTPYVTDTVYSTTSLLQQLQLSTGGGKRVWQTFQYEKGTDRLTRSVVDIEGVTGPAKAANYSYDQVGNVLSISDTSGASPDVQCFAYDTGQRLAEAWTPAASPEQAAGSGTAGGQLGGSSPAACGAAPGQSALGGPAPYWKSYTVDAIGNRTKEIVHDTGLDAAKDVTRTYTYGEGDAGPHAVTEVVENTPTGDRQSTYSYDASGNTTERILGGDTQTLHWDAEGQLTRTVEADGREATYLYDADGNRVIRRDATATTVYLPGMELRLPKGGSEVEATRYYSFAGQTIAVRTDDGKLSFLASDHHGTGELAIDAATGAVAQRRFDPYGLERGRASGTWPGEKGFVGGTIDAQTGLTSIGAREYDSSLGRFISVDPIIDYTSPQQINGYAYANNTPVTLSDPTGLAIPECMQGLIKCQGGLPIPSSKGGGYVKPDKEVTEAQENLDRAQRQYSSAKKQVKRAAKELVEIAKDILGINAAMDCFSSGDLAACGETALNIAGSFVGGLAGKILAKYGAPWNWAKGAKLAKRVWGLLDDLVGGAKDMWSSSKTVGKAKDALKAAKAKLTRKSKCHSFLPGTGVLLADGTSKPIEEVGLGDKVTVTDPETGETTVREVVATIVTEDDKHFVDLTIATGEGSAALISTTTHPFWVESEQEWIEAGDLEPGMELRTPDGDTVTLTGTRDFEKRQRTHDLTIAGIHTYYVLAADQPVLVHNVGGSKGGYGDACRLFHPGENTHDWIDARGPERDWKAQEIRDVNDIGNKYGCHTCGAAKSGYKSGTWVKDHQPVSTFINKGDSQILLPQCRSCSAAQGRAAAQMKRDGINPYKDL